MRQRLLLAGLALAGVAWAQPVASPAFPSWLTPFPGGSASVREAAESAYVTTARPAEVIAHYRTLFAEAGFAFAANYDGLGTSVRASLPDCDLLLTIRESSAGGAQVKLHCTAPRAAGAALDLPAEVPVKFRRPSLEELRRCQDEHTRQVHAEAEAQSRQRTAEMSRFDVPVYPQNEKPFYRDDAPALTWPAWLVAFGGAPASRPAAGVDQSHTPYLESRYQTDAPMSQLYQFYIDLIRANGFERGPSQLNTGQTISGIIQAKNGIVEGHRRENGAVNGPSTNIKVSFGRTVLNAPIDVRLRVTVRGSFGR